MDYTDLQSKHMQFKKPCNLDHELVLYYHHNSYYSQKVLLTLYEKGIHFIPYEIDVINGEHYSNWFLEINPKGELPVLQNGLLIIPESSQIINYLETNYVADGQYKKLIPKLDGTNGKLIERIIFFSKLINRVPVGALSMGTLIHAEICQNPKPPFIGPVRQVFLKYDENLSDTLRYFAQINPTHGDMLLRKADFHDKKRKIIANLDEFHKIMETVESIFNEIENELHFHYGIVAPQLTDKQLANGNSTYWLCCKEFTLADICFGILLHRLDLIGLGQYYWSNNKRPHIEKYFSKLKRRDSFIKSLPSSLEVWKTVWHKSPITYKLGFGFLSLSSLVVVGSLILKKD